MFRQDSRSAGVLLVRLSALLRARAHGHRMEQDQGSLYHLRQGSVLWNDEHRAVARLYYTLVAMGKADQLHDDIFKEIQSTMIP